MTKKIKELTYEEIIKYCTDNPCMYCPFKIGLFDTCVLVNRPLDWEKKKNFLEQEVEVEDDKEN